MRSRKKGQEESITVYITAIQALCHEIDDKMSQEQIIEYSLNGLDADMAAQIQLFNPDSVGHLLMVAKNVELSFERAKRVIGESSNSKPKRTNAVSHTNEQGSDPDVMTQVMKLTESINNMQFNKNKGQNNAQNRRGRGHFRNNQGQNRQNYGSNNIIQRNNGQNVGNSGNRGFRANNSYFNNRGNHNQNYGFNRNNNVIRNNSIQCYECKGYGHVRANCGNNLQQQNNGNNQNRQNGQTTQNVQANPNVNNVNSVNSDEQVQTNATYVQANITLNSSASHIKSLIEIDVQVNGHNFSALVDSGAELTLMR